MNLLHLKKKVRLSCQCFSIVITSTKFEQSKLFHRFAVFYETAEANIVKLLNNAFISLRKDLEKPVAFSSLSSLAFKIGQTELVLTQFQISLACFWTHYTLSINGQQNLWCTVFKQTKRKSDPSFLLNLAARWRRQSSNSIYWTWLDFAVGREWEVKERMLGKSGCLLVFLLALLGLRLSFSCNSYLHGCVIRSPS